MWVERFFLNFDPENQRLQSKEAWERFAGPPLTVSSSRI